MKLQSWLVRAMAVAALVVSPVIAAAQSAVATADAAAFVGSWTLSLESPQGAFEQTIAFGQIAAEADALLAEILGK